MDHDDFDQDTYDGLDPALYASFDEEQGPPPEKGHRGWVAVAFIIVLLVVLL
jgi:hypothetical protein